MLSRVGQNTIALIKDLEAWSAVAQITRKPFFRPLASFDKRVIAFLIDLFISFVLFIVFPNVVTTSTIQFALLNIDIIFFLVLFWVYLTLLEGFAGQSIGKLLTRIKVVRTTGEDLFYDHAAVRNFGKVFLLPFDIAFGLRLKDARFIRFFDKFSGTTVIDLEPSSPSTDSDADHQKDHSKQATQN